MNKNNKDKTSNAIMIVLLIIMTLIIFYFCYLAFKHMSVITSLVTTLFLLVFISLMWFKALRFDSKLRIKKFKETGNFDELTITDYCSDDDVMDILTDPKKLDKIKKDYEYSKEKERKKKNRRDNLKKLNL